MAVRADGLELGFNPRQGFGMCGWGLRAHVEERTLPARVQCVAMARAAEPMSV